MLRRVQNDYLQRLIKRSEFLLRYSSRRRGFVMRFLLCWVIGCIGLASDELTNYDKRFQLRGPQKASKDVVLLTLSPSDFSNMYDARVGYLDNISEVTDITDSFYWNKKTWFQLLNKLLKHEPRSIGVTLYFGDNIGTIRSTNEEKNIFLDDRIVWASTTTSLERSLIPVFANNSLSNIGSNELRRDSDGVVRRIFSQRGETAHLIERLTGKSFPQSRPSWVINYRGGQHQFASYSLSELLFDEIPSQALKGKVIIIGAETSSGPVYITPQGTMSRAEILANATDNILANRSIKRFPFAIYAALFFVLTLIAVFLITTYPQTVALFFIWWVATAVAALSAWVFDTFYFWIPAFSQFLLLGASWIIFIGYQATKIEKKNYQLQKEQLYMQELEQLKNNFVSLISHDLKTPIAKIQAIVDRLLTQDRDPELTQDLKSLRIFGDELNRYIQSILKVLRVESRDFKINKEAADINEVIEESLRFLQPLAANKKISVTTELEPMFSLEFDVTLIKEVINNLIENAIKYTQENGSITITSYEDADFINVIVKDTGEGIKPEDLDKVWQKFTRGSDQDLKTKGTGLGLYLVKYFIELHGGKVHMESTLGQGTTVSFRLPLEDETENEVRI